MELELQLVNTNDYDLAPYSDDMLRLMSKLPLPGSVVPEMTSSMIEISTGVCHSSSEVLGQLTQIRDALVKCADKLNIAITGGGTHPFQQWHERRIYDKPRFQELSQLYGYLSKQFTIFGQHVHIGCPDANAALLMLHRMSRYIPHCIALSASWVISPRASMPRSWSMSDADSTGLLFARVFRRTHMIRRPPKSAVTTSTATHSTISPCVALVVADWASTVHMDQAFPEAIAWRMGMMSEGMRRDSIRSSA